MDPFLKPGNLPIRFPAPRTSQQFPFMFEGGGWETFFQLMDNLELRVIQVFMRLDDSHGEERNDQARDSKWD
jgi:hypothetical protein